MKVALIGPVYPYRGGIAHYTTMVCGKLQEQGHAVLLVSFKRQYPRWLFPGRTDKDPSAKPLEVKSANYWIDPLNPISWLLTSARLWRNQPDTVVLQWWTSFWTPAWLAIALATKLVLRKPLVIVCHNVLPHETRWWDTYLARLVLSRATRLIVQSKSEMKRLLSLLPKAEVDIVSHPVYDMFADQSMSKKQARRQLGLSPDIPILLFFGIVREYKGLQDLLAALPRIEAQLGGTRLVVAGEFWEDKLSYERLIERLGIGDLVILEDRYIRNEEVPVYFSAADVLVAPYRETTGSGAVQMALGFGCPVITTRVGELDSAVRDGTTGLITKPADPPALANAVIRFFKEGLAPVSRTENTEGNEANGWHKLVAVIEDAGKVCESLSC